MCFQHLRGRILNSKPPQKELVNDVDSTYLTPIWAHTIPNTYDELYDMCFARTHTSY